MSRLTPCRQPYLRSVPLNIEHTVPISSTRPPPPPPPPESGAVPQNLRGFRGRAGGPGSPPGAVGGREGAGGTVYWEALGRRRGGVEEEEGRPGQGSHGGWCRWTDGARQSEKLIH